MNRPHKPTKAELKAVKTVGKLLDWQKQVKAVVDYDEAYPVFSLVRDTREDGIVAHVPKIFIAQYKKVMDDYDKMQEQLRILHENGVPNVPRRDTRRRTRRSTRRKAQDRD